MKKAKSELKILTINIDYTLAMDLPEFGDVQKRNIDYGKRVGEIFSITHSPKKMGLAQKDLSTNVHIFPTSSVSPLFFLFDALMIAKKICRQHRIDVVLSQDPFITGFTAWVIKKIYGAAFLIHFHGDFWENKFWLREKWYNFLLLWLSKFLVKRADGIKVVSTGIKRKLLRGGVNPKKVKIRIIPTPVDLEKFSRPDFAKVREIRTLNGRRKTIINVGRCDPAKDYRTLGQAVSLVYEKCRNLAFCQVGAGKKLYRTIKADDNLLISFLDKIPQDELINYYHASDVYVSSSRHESFGKVLIEAMAAGLPVVATATTGSKDIVLNEQTGFLVPVGDSQALAKKTLYLLTNPRVAKEMGRAGRAWVLKKFGRDKIINQIVNFWQCLSK